MAATTPAGAVEYRVLGLANTLVFLFAASRVQLGIVGSVLVMGVILRRVAMARRMGRDGTHGSQVGSRGDAGAQGLAFRGMARN